jgi:hypothetical protein
MHPGEKMKPIKLTGILFTLIGLAALIGAAVSVIRTRAFMRNSVPTSGEIVGIATTTDIDSDGHRSTSHFPIIRFSDGEGNKVEFQSSSSISGGITVGQMVAVRYLPDNPAEARMARSFMDIWGFSLLSTLLGAAFASLGIFFFRYGIRNPRMPADS